MDEIKLNGETNAKHHNNKPLKPNTMTCKHGADRADLKVNKSLQNKEYNS